MDPDRFSAAKLAPEPVASTVQVPTVIFYRGPIRRPSCPACSSDATTGLCTKGRTRYYRCDKCSHGFKAQRIK